MRDDDVLVCNCAGCQIEMVSVRTPPDMWNGRRPPAGRINGRPYCDGCLRTKRLQQKPATRDEYSP